MSQYGYSLFKYIPKWATVDRTSRLLDDPEISDDSHAGGMLISHGNNMDSDPAAENENRAAIKLRKLANFVNAHQSPETRIIDRLIHESAARLLKSHIPVCPRCGIGQMQTLGFVMCNPRKSGEQQFAELCSEPTFRCDHAECRFESHHPVGAFVGRA